MTLSCNYMNAELGCTYVLFVNTAVLSFQYGVNALSAMNSMETEVETRDATIMNDDSDDDGTASLVASLQVLALAAMTVLTLTHL